MGYLICNECGGYYELQDGESPEDFSEKCTCGGNLEYVESLDSKSESKSLEDTIKCSSCGAEFPEGKKFCGECGTHLSVSDSKPQTEAKKESSPKKDVSTKYCETCGQPLRSSKKFDMSNQKNRISKILLNAKEHWLKLNSRMKIASLGGLVILLALIGIFFVSGNTAAAHYENNSISFDYPKEWNLTYINLVPISAYTGGTTSNTSDATSNTSDATSNTSDATSNTSDATSDLAGLDPNTMVGELSFTGPGINAADIKIYVIPPGFVEQELSDRPKQTLNGYTYYERIGTGGNAHNTGIFLKDKMGYTILVAGKKDQANAAFKMIVNSFRIK